MTDITRAFRGFIPANIAFYCGEVEKLIYIMKFRRVYPPYPPYPTYPRYPSYPRYPYYRPWWFKTPSYPPYPTYPTYPTYPKYPTYMSKPTVNVEKITAADLNLDVISFWYSKIFHCQMLMLVGFGFAMSYVRRYYYSCPVYNGLFATMATMLTVIYFRFLFTEIGDIPFRTTLMEIYNFYSGHYAAVTTLISAGALVGRLSFLQLLVMACIEMCVAKFSEMYCRDTVNVADAAGGLLVHVFGCFFALGVALMIGKNVRGKSKCARPKEPSYHGELRAMLGTAAQWVFWPSYHAACVSTQKEEYRALVNAMLSVLAATVSSFMMTTLVTPGGRLELRLLRNAPNAGSAIVGCISNMFLWPFWATLYGFIGGIVNVIGYKYVDILMSKIFGDTGGVLYAHGTCGILSALASAWYSSQAKREEYFETLETVFPAMRLGSAAMQQTAQITALYMTLIVSICAGLVTGFILRVFFCVFPKPRPSEAYDEGTDWICPEKD